MLGRRRHPAVVHVSSSHGWRGDDRQLVARVERLAARGVPQLVVCGEGSELERLCRRHELRYVALRGRATLGASFAHGLARAADALDADLLHVHDRGAYAAAVLARAMFRAHARIVVDLRLRARLAAGGGVLADDATAARTLELYEQLLARHVRGRAV